MISRFLENSTNEIKLFSERCLRRRLSRFSCTLCIDNCPSQALELVKGQVHFDQFQCTACGRCVSVCPSETFESTTANIYREIKNKKTDNVLFSCYGHQTGTPEEITLPCLGIISPEVILYLASSKYTSVSLNTEGCSKCGNSKAAHSLLKSIELLRTDFSDFINTTIKVSNRPGTNTEVPSVRRRSFLQTIGKEISELVSSQISAKKAPESTAQTAIKKLSAKRKLLNESPLFKDAHVRDKLCPQMVLTEACTLCPLCTGMCPTGALKRVRSNNAGKTLSFTPLLCSECGLCEDFCPRKAITISKVLTNYL